MPDFPSSLILDDLGRLVLNYRLIRPQSSPDRAEPSMSISLRVNWILLSLVPCWLTSACDSDEDGTARVPGDVSEAVEQHLWGAGYYSGGDWEPDFNDGAFYGIAFYIREGLEQGNAEYVERAGETMTWNASILQRACREPLSYFAVNLDTVVMAMLGSIEYVAATGEIQHLPPELPHVRPGPAEAGDREGGLLQRTEGGLAVCRGVPL